MQRPDHFSLAAWLVALPRYTKRAVLAVSDLVLLNVALWLAIFLRIGELVTPQNPQSLLVLATGPLLTLIVFFALGLYRSVTRFPGGTLSMSVIFGLVAATLCWGVPVILANENTFPRSVLLIYPMVAAILVLGSRHLAGRFLRAAGVRSERTASPLKRAIIYGADNTGMQLLEALRSAHSCSVMAFIDPSTNLPGQYVGGVKVFRPERLAGLVRAWGVDEVLLAIPKARQSDCRAALRQLETMNVKVRLLPAMEDVATGRVTVSDLRPVDAEDLLGRDPITPDPGLLARSITGKHVMVTGAGGSIGSELGRQIVRQRPARLVLVEMSEAHLYEADLQIRALIGKLGPDLIAPVVSLVLGSVLDVNLMRRVIRENAIDIIFHAAAFKHVPIVEHNPVVGLQNNTFGTCALADVAAEEGVGRFVLVSTDKAVRPTSVMGASKRLAEMALQARASETRGSTIFAIVRFGNVLDSSGSVLRRFRTQIEAGGPVTVTHPGMVRYFMSIPEAAALVIQAGAMAEGGDIFVLDMGEPIKIVDLARTMIRLMGQEVRDADNPDGDIAITFIGRRDGEKLYEELQLGENVVSTSHPRIRRCFEPYLEKPILDEALERLLDAMSDGRTAIVRDALSRAVETYVPEERGVARVA